MILALVEYFSLCLYDRAFSAFVGGGGRQGTDIS